MAMDNSFRPAVPEGLPDLRRQVINIQAWEVPPAAKGHGRIEDHHVLQGTGGLTTDDGFEKLRVFRGVTPGKVLMREPAMMEAVKNPVMDMATLEVPDVGRSGN